jgi:hypothetical protein
MASGKCMWSVLVRTRTVEDRVEADLLDCAASGRTCGPAGGQGPVDCQ